MHLDLCTGEVCTELAPSYVSYVKSAIRCGMFTAETVHASLTGTAVKHSKVTNPRSSSKPSILLAAVFCSISLVLWCLHMIVDMLQGAVHLLSVCNSQLLLQRKTSM